jgi:capsular exopolysaccharide synthesis family protein
MGSGPRLDGGCMWHDGVLVDEDAEGTTSRRIAPILWSGKYIIIASVVVMVALALLYTAHSAKVYEATSILQVNIPNRQENNETTGANQGLAQNYATLLVSPGFLSKIRSKVEGGRLSVGELESRLSAGAITQTALIKLHSTGPSPEAAARLGGQVADAFLESLQSEASTRTEHQEAQVQQAITKLSTQIAQLKASSSATTPQTAAQISALQASLQALVAQSATLVTNGLVQGSSTTLSAPPSASSTPIKPRRSLNVLGGIVLGLLLGVGLAWLRDLLRPGIRSAAEAGTVLDVPILASIPLRPRPSSEDPALAEAYDLLHTNVLFAMRDHGLKVITFLGPNPQVGKTSAVEGMARVAARGGERVLLIDGDLRASALSTRVGPTSQVGIVDVLQQRIDLDEALISLGPNLSLLPSAPSTANSPSLLSGSAMRSLIHEAREQFDTILIDSPPIAELADGLILASLSDAVVLVIRAGVTKPNDLRAAATSLRQSHSTIAGLVVFEQRPVSGYYPSSRESKHRSAAPAAR